MLDLHGAGIDILTLGQYLRPTKRHITVQKYIPPVEFDGWKEEALKIGFKYVASGPLVRSSYRAGELYLKGILSSNNSENKVNMSV